MRALFCVVAASVCFSHTAKAQVSGAIMVQNDDRFRGRSVSEGEPVAIASIIYDLESGVSVGGSVVGTTNGNGVGVSRASGHVSYAQSVGQGFAVDGGFVVQTYTDRYSSGQSQTFVEAYGGLTWKQFALHASYSPSYLDAGLETLYVELNTVQDLGDGFRANARAGLLQRLSGEGSFGGENTRWDAQIGVTKDFDRLSAFVNFSTAGSGEGTYFDDPWQGRNAVIFGVSRSF
ncbi:MAG: TorF family putative porin [Pseudomonadota bacterium]